MAYEKNKRKKLSHGVDYLSDDVLLTVLSFCEPKSKVEVLQKVSKRLKALTKDPFAWCHPIKLKLFESKGIRNWCSAWSTSHHISLVFDINVTIADIVNVVQHLNSVEILKLQRKPPAHSLSLCDLELRDEEFNEVIEYLPRTIRELTFIQYTPFYNVHDEQNREEFSLMLRHLKRSVGDTLEKVTLDFGLDSIFGNLTAYFKKTWKTDCEMMSPIWSFTPVLDGGVGGDGD